MLWHTVQCHVIHATPPHSVLALDARQCYPALFRRVSSAQEGTMWCLFSGISDMRGETICSNFWWYTSPLRKTLHVIIELNLLVSGLMHSDSLQNRAYCFTCFRRLTISSQGIRSVVRCMWSGHLWLMSKGFLSDANMKHMLWLSTHAHHVVHWCGNFRLNYKLSSN